MVIDRAKAEKARKVLGTETLAATVDAAFEGPPFARTADPSCISLTPARGTAAAR
jgi:hypothetical protein